MLKSLVPNFVCPCCRDTRQTLSLHAFKDNELEVLDGALQCPGCKSVFPIRERLLELVAPPLLEPATLDYLEKNYGPQLAAIGYSRHADTGTAKHKEEYHEQMLQREHFDNYAEGQVQHYTDYAAMPFWRATDKWTFERWQTQIKPGEMFLDIGCADGRSTFPYLPRNTVIGLDISRKMIERAIAKAVAEGYQGKFSFFVCDGSALPFRDNTFPYVQTYGVLHHLPNPGAVSREIQRVLKPEGIHFASENNHTIFRFLFDLLMKIAPIWYEEAGEEALISRKMINEWTREMPVKTQSQTIVFLLPHMYNWFSNKVAYHILHVTNRLFSFIPVMKNNGGLIVFTIQKKAA